MIKVTDLMVGDYVTFADCIENPPLISIKIVALSFQDGGDEKSSLVSINNDKACDIIDIDEEIVGIPLTPEILEKNGFTKDNDDKLYKSFHLLVPTGYEKDSFTIQITLYKKPICGVTTLFKCWGWIPPFQGGVNDLHICNLVSVHELQHALKLLGINKEIIL